MTYRLDHEFYMIQRYQDHLPIDQIVINAKEFKWFVQSRDIQKVKDKKLKEFLEKI